MKNNIKLWESEFKNNYIFFKTFEELTNYLEQKNINLNFRLYETQYPNTPQKELLSNITNKENISITYTDINNPITIINNEILINPYFFNKYKNKFKEYSKTKLIEQIKNGLFIIIIPDYLIDNELVNFLTSSKEIEGKFINIINIIGTTLNETQIKKLKQLNLEIMYQGEKVGTKKILKNYTEEDLKNDLPITLEDNLTNEELEKLIITNKSKLITIIPSQTNINDERIYFNNISRIFNYLKSHDKNYNISIQVEDRELFRQSNLLNHPNNINLKIYNEFYHYSKEEYLNEEAKLNELIRPIKETKLSPYEKYLAVYNIVKQFKPYQENNENKDEARYLRYILNNNYIVCLGYSKLLTTLLNRVGISSIETALKVDNSKHKNPLENSPTALEGHARNIIKIDDDKYNIHGIFIADATRDNLTNYDLYNNSTMTFDNTKESYKLETLTKEDLLLDFHNFKEFLEKINFYLKRTINQSSENNYNDKITNTYKSIYIDIMNILIKLDYKKYKELSNKYENLIINKTTLKELENIYSDFLTEYALYIIPLSNQKIDTNTIITAATNVKQKINKLRKKALEEWEEKTKIANKTVKNLLFPYTYNPNDPRPNYLESPTTENTIKR